MSADEPQRRDRRSDQHLRRDDEMLTSPAEPPTPGSHDVWRASASFGRLIGFVLLVLSGAGVVLLLLRVPSATGGQRLAWLVLAVLLVTLTIGIAVVLRALPSMRYRFVADALIVEWMARHRVVPLTEIEQIVFEPHQPFKLPRWEPFWPGYYVATIRTPGGTWHSWATQAPHRRVRLVTAHGIVAISPERPVRFLAELERRRLALGQPPPSIDDSATMPSSLDHSPRHRDADPTGDPQSVLAGGAAHFTDEPAEPGTSEHQQERPRRPVQPEVGSRQPVVRWVRAYRDLFMERLLTDHIASALVALGIVLPVLMVAYLYSQFEGLPDQIPIHWDAAGDVNEVTTPSGLWRFPRIAVILLVLNTSLATLLVSIDRYLARLLLAGIPLAQIALFVALVRAVN